MILKEKPQQYHHLIIKNHVVTLMGKLNAQIAPKTFYQLKLDVDLSPSTADGDEFMSL